MTLYTFQSNIINIYGKKGEAWLDELPELVEKISLKLSLHALEPVPNLSHNYVLSGLRAQTPIILKLGLDNKALAREAFALQCFAECGTVKVLTGVESLRQGYFSGGILLLERAVPGSSLKSYFPNKESEAVEIACTVIKTS